VSDFRVYSNDRQIDGGGFYFIESTAPDAVEGDPSGGVPTPPSLHAVDTDQAVKDVAAFLTPEDLREAETMDIVLATANSWPVIFPNRSPATY
jgi:hypothetical protein